MRDITSTGRSAMDAEGYDFGRISFTGVTFVVGKVKIMNEGFVSYLNHFSKKIGYKEEDIGRLRVFSAFWMRN